MGAIAGVNRSCQVCSNATHPLAYCCRRCKKLLDRVDIRRKADKQARPRDESDIVLAAALINDMNSDMSEDEFKIMVTQLASRFAGGTFDEAVFRLKHWKR